MKKDDQEFINKDELGENVAVEENPGLSNPEAEEAGDFEGGGKIRTRHIHDGKGSAGTTVNEIDYDKIDTGTTGTNAKKDPNNEKSGKGEEDFEKDSRQNNVSL